LLHAEKEKPVEQQHILATIDLRLLGARLRSSRERAGLSIGQTIQVLRERYQVEKSFSIRSLWALEKGTKRVVEEPLLMKLAELYGVPITDLIRAAELPTDPITIIAPSSRARPAKGWQHALWV
jgi:transcriptional regulator with XRE-family HTH domain